MDTAQRVPGGDIGQVQHDGVLDMGVAAGEAPNATRTDFLNMQYHTQGNPIARQRPVDVVAVRHQAVDARSGLRAKVKQTDPRYVRVQRGRELSVEATRQRFGHRARPDPPSQADTIGDMIAP